MATVINLVANATIALSVVMFMAELWREHEHNPVSRMPWYLRTWIKTSLTVVSTGAMANCFFRSSPIVSEIVLNCGLAMVFSWAFCWHRQRWAKHEHLNSGKQQQ